MSFNLDLKEHGAELQQLYESVLSSDPKVTYAIMEYEPSSNCLEPGPSGDGGLDDFCEGFDDSRIEYGFARVEVNGVHKIVFVAWIGENVSTRLRLLFNAHVALVAKQFPRHHVQITARASDELSPAIIAEKLNAAAGSKYALSAKPSIATKPRYVKAEDGADEKDWGNAAPVNESDLGVKSGSGYTSSVRDELNKLKLAKTKGKGSSTESDDKPLNQKPVKDEEEEEKEPELPAKKEEKVEEEKPVVSEKKPVVSNEGSIDDDSKGKTSIAGLDSSSSYKPVGKIDLKKIRAEGRNSKFADARIEKIEPSYKPVGKIDLKKIREQARKEKDAASARFKKEAENLSEKTEDAVQKATKASYGFKQNLKQSLETTEDEVRDEAHKLHEAEEEHLGSLADRIKAFQSSVNSAKPQHEVKSRKPVSTPRPQPSRPAVSQREPEEKTEEKTEQEPEQEEPEHEEEEEKDSKKEPVREPSPEINASEPSSKASVGGFAARFAKKTPEPVSKPKEVEPEEEEEAAPPPPSRAAREPEPVDEPVDEPADEPVPTPARRQPIPEPEPETEPETAEPEPEPETEAAESNDETFTGVAVTGFEAQDDDELSFKEGEQIEDIIKTDENWYLGRNTKGETGLFPATCVQLDGDLEADAEPEVLAKGIALFDYAGSDADELSFAKDETVEVLDKTSEAWFTGKNEKGEVGLFPSSYIKLE